MSQDTNSWQLAIGWW